MKVTGIRLVERILRSLRGVSGRGTEGARAPLFPCRRMGLSEKGTWVHLLALGVCFHASYRPADFAYIADRLADVS